MFYLLGGAYPERAPGAWVTPGYIPGFGVRASLGRVLVASDFETGRPMVAMISHQLWQSRFGGDPAILGRYVTAYFSDRPDESESLEIVGVIAPEFWQTNLYTEVIAPLRVAEERVSTLVRALDASAPRVSRKGVGDLFRICVLPEPGNPAESARSARRKGSLAFLIRPKKADLRRKRSPTPFP